jgi:hypothetical protein
MKTTGFLFTALVYSTNAWVFPSKEVIAKTASAVGVAAAIGASPLIANAAQADFSGSFSDPKHPNCQRVITVNGNNANVVGTDGHPGCPADGSGKKWKLSGKINGDSIVFDFSKKGGPTDLGKLKGGPTDLEGVWDASSPVGIKYADGNKWTLKSRN